MNQLSNYIFYPSKYSGPKECGKISSKVCTLYFSLVAQIYNLKSFGLKGNSLGKYFFIKFRPLFIVSGIFSGHKSVVKN